MLVLILTATEINSETYYVYGSFHLQNALEILTKLCPSAQNVVQTLLLQGKKICQKSALGAVVLLAVGYADPALCQSASGHWQITDRIWQEKARGPQSQKNRGCGCNIHMPSFDILIFTKVGISIQVYYMVFIIVSSPNHKKDLVIKNC